MVIVPFDDFIENHIMQASKNELVGGKRVELGDRMNTKKDSF